MSHADRQGNALAVAGILLLAAGLVSVPPVLALLLRRPRGFLPDTVDLLRLMACALITGGALLVLFRRRVSILLNLGLAASSLLVAMTGVELILRKFDPQIPQSTHLFEPHPVWGWQLNPGGSAMAVFPSDHRSRVTVSSAGLRDREYPEAKPPGVKRILLLGDSFTSGIDVDACDVFTEVMEDSLLRGVGVLNFGVNGFGPTQEYLLLKGRGLRYQPDLVLMVVYLRNDLDDILGTLDWGFGYHRPRAVLDSAGDISIESPPSAPPARGRPTTGKRLRLPALSRLHLGAFLRSRLADPRALERMPPEVRLSQSDSTGEDSRAYDLLRGILKRTDAVCREAHSRFAVVIAPSLVQVYPEQYWGQIRKTYHLAEDATDLYRPNKILAGICGDLNVPFLDLTPALKSEAAKGRKMYYRKDQHWNRLGHSLVAREIVRFLSLESWITPEEGRVAHDGT